MNGDHEHQGTATDEGASEPQGRELTTVHKAKAELIVGEEGYIAPRSVEEALRMADAVIAGRLAPDSYNNDRSKIMLGIMAALEAGLPPLYGLRNIAIINGRPTIWGDAAVALVQSKDLIEEHMEKFIGDIDPKDLPADLTKWPNTFGFEVALKRKGQKGFYVGRFTVGDAKRAKLWLNGRKVPWIEHPQRMLKIRARAIALRDGFADALAGLAIREEVEDHAAPEPAPEIDLTSIPILEAPPLPEEEGEQT